MSLSVVVPNYNHAKWIARSVYSLLKQSEPADEIIIVDDASTDNSIAVIEELMRAHASIRLIRHETNRGAAAAITTGLTSAQCELVFFASADDFFLPGILQRARAAFRSHPEAALFCAGAAMADSENNILAFRPFTEPAQSSSYLPPQEVRKLSRVSDNWIIGATAIYRRERLLAVGGFDAALGSFCDGIVVRNLALRHGFYFDPEILAVFVVYPESFSARSALSPSKSRALIDIAHSRGLEVFPEDIRESYSDLVARRLRFGMARLSFVFSSNDPSADSVSKVFNGNAIDRRMLQLLSRTPIINRSLVLGWMFFRTRPFGIGSIIRSWWHHLRRDPSRRARVAPLITELSSVIAKDNEVRHDQS